jgi:hypothetical protein
VARLRSWNSSNITAETPDRFLSVNSIRGRMPSVMNRTRVSGDTADSNRVWYPISSPGALPRSSATRAASMRAASRRGSRTSIWPSQVCESRSICGTCVDLPEPVGARTIRHFPSETAETIRLRYSRTGRLIVSGMGHFGQFLPVKGELTDKW